MKFKTSAVAMAVAGIVAAPVVQAGADEIYASARIGLENVDTGGISDLRVRSFGSRFGARGEADLGNGMTGFGRYEWDVDFTDSASDDVSDNSYDADNDGVTIRHRYVGVKGDFGSVTIGQAYHSYYNLVYGPTDNPWWGSGYVYPSTGRQADGITYAGSAGAVNYSLTGIFSRDADEESPDETQVAVSFGIGDMTLGIGVRTFADNADDPATTGQDESDNVIGVVLHGIPLGDASLGVGFQSQDERDAFVIEALIGNAYVHYESGSADDLDVDPSALTLGYTQSLGRKTTMWYEVISTDADTGDSDDDLTVLRAVLKYDII